MRCRSWLPRRKWGRMRVMARRADLAIDGPEVSFPIPTRPPVHARFPVAVCRAVTAATKGGALDDFQMSPVASLEQLQIRFVMAVEAVVVAVVPAMGHYDVVMLLGNDHISR